MASNRRQNNKKLRRRSKSSHRNISTDNFKWTPNRKIIFFELYDQAIAKNCFKDPTPLGREFIVDKFNKEFNLNINYRFFKENLDQLKRKCKKYKHLMKNFTGISVDTTTSVISASNSWWQESEVYLMEIIWQI
ncbi:unnamed protein product [Arabidopsis lyrata]|uniref:Myb/SANT-like domain-containing protein n=1 Tax=Arabidopsis lyrata subsp. lyrata TaxID=81972 RepID=D7MPD0_ARALL|nr:hypothetical protein ARALYDRAFT_917954 [Arabidopsis lyrata subsp. lyrata]CAH8279053.1 unnamed protein product [Arabidopsis lyrata]